MPLNLELAGNWTLCSPAAVPFPPERIRGLKLGVNRRAYFVGERVADRSQPVRPISTRPPRHAHF